MKGAAVTPVLGLRQSAWGRGPNTSPFAPGLSSQCWGSVDGRAVADVLYHGSVLEILLECRGKGPQKGSAPQNSPWSPSKGLLGESVGAKHWRSHARCPSFYFSTKKVLWVWARCFTNLSFSLVKSSSSYFLPGHFWARRKSKNTNADCFCRFISVGVSLWLEVLYSVKMQIPYRRNGILKLLSIIYTWVCMKVLSPFQTAGFDVMVGHGREMRWGQLRTLERDSPNLTGSGERDPGVPAMTQPTSQSLGVLFWLSSIKTSNTKSTLFVEHFPSVSSLFLLASGKFMVWKIKVRIYFHYQRICKTELGLSELTFAFAIP